MYVAIPVEDGDIEAEATDWQGRKVSRGGCSGLAR